ncbi:MAG: hypothetical protein ACHQPI_10990 [Thermoanaerobaculia bacterium]
MYERHSQPLAHPRVFLKRLFLSAIVGIGLIAISLFLGMLGYHVLVDLPWIDSFLDAAMILSGMGPITTPRTPAGKLFAGFYALYSGLLLIAVAGITFAPVIHRFFHSLHLPPGK